MSSPFSPVDPKQNFPKLEEKILGFWQAQDVFQKSVAPLDPATGQARPLFVFYEGPPTANGLPGIHHVLSRAFKDVIPRYKTMRGYRVPRKAGWDCHGLPVEVEVEKRLGLRGKQQIEELGVAAFNRHCRDSVFRYIKEWDRLTARIGFWLDTEHPYRTLDNSYIESCWGLLGELWRRGLLVKDYKVVKHCPRCGTSLAEAEAGQGMKEDVDDPSVFVRLRLRPGQALPVAPGNTDGAPVSILIWTTTPWTLPANAAVAVSAEAVYAVYELPLDGAKEYVIFLQSQAETILKGKKDPVLQGTLTGTQLAGLRYEPLYPGVGQGGADIDTSAAYRILVDQTVELGEGTGAVHIAPAYGDLEVGRRHGLPVLFSVGLDGLVLPAFYKFAGKFFKDADPLVTRELKERGLLWNSGRIKHSYPFCWRCDTPLLYFAKDSWYIKTTAVREQLLAQNQRINWYPEHIKDGRFGDWLRNNVDWAISRERYWGTPLPLWVCDKTGAIECIGSIDELSKKAGRDLRKDGDFDLHRPYIDSVTWPSAAGGTMRRVRDVIDCWFDSGAMPYAQHHYPFEHQNDFGELFPAAFISEGVDQTRGWFYTLHALGVLLRGGPAFENCIVLGHILDDQGRKMSKRLGNIVDPWTVLHAEGADALRYYLYTASPPGQPRRFSQSLVQKSLRQFLLTLWNCYSFYVTYAEAEYDRLGRDEVPLSERPQIDLWILGSLHRLLQNTTALLERYDITQAARGIADFVDILSNWYVRRCRDRFWASLDGPGGEIGGALEKDKRAAYQTLHTCLVTVAQITAPFAPFVAEELWQNLKRRIDPQAELSVHLSRWPEADVVLLGQTEQLRGDMEVALKAVSLGRALKLVDTVAEFEHPIVDACDPGRPSRVRGERNAGLQAVVVVACGDRLVELTAIPIDGECRVGLRAPRGKAGAPPRRQRQPHPDRAGGRQRHAQRLLGLQRDRVRATRAHRRRRSAVQQRPGRHRHRRGALRVGVGGSRMQRVGQRGDLRGLARKGGVSANLDLELPTRLREARERCRVEVRLRGRGLQFAIHLPQQGPRVGRACAPGQTRAQRGCRPSDRHMPCPATR